MWSSARLLALGAAALSASVALGAAGVAMAQQAPGDQQATGDNVQTFTPDTNAIDSITYDRGRNVSVLDRPRPDYQAVGVKAGGFTLFPKISLDGAYDDNIFAVQTGAVGDFIFEATPELDIQSNWSRNSLSAYARVTQDAYARYSNEDTTQVGAGVAGKLQFGDSDFTGGVDYGYLTLSRAISDNIGLSKDPIQYNYVAANGQLATELTRVRLSIRVDDEDYQYQNGTTSSGTLVFAQADNHNSLMVTGKAELAVNPDVAVYLIAQGNGQMYEMFPASLSNFDKNSTGYYINGGANFDITHLVRGEVELGYLSQRYESSAFKPIEGLSGKAQIEWFPTQLTTVTLVASRTVGDAVVPGSAGYLTTDGSVRVDHELLRNLILSADGWTGYDQYNGLNRSDTRTGADFSAEWLLTRHVGLTFAYKFANQKSSGASAGPSFDDNRGTITVVLQL